MKILKLVSNREYVLEDDEAEYLVKVIENGTKFIRLSNGDFMAVSSVSIISEPEKVPTWGGYILAKTDGGYSFMRGDERIYLEQHNINEIEFKEDPKYQLMNKVKLLK